MANRETKIKIKNGVIGHMYESWRTKKLIIIKLINKRRNLVENEKRQDISLKSK